MRGFICAMAALLACLQPAFAQTPAVTKTVLPNGLTVLVKEEPGSGLVAVQAFVKAGAAQERDSQAGIGNLVARVLLSSTRNRSQDRLAAAFDEVGGSFQTDWYPDFTVIGAITTASHFDDAVTLLGDVLLNAEFDPDVVQRAQTSVLTDIESAGDDVFETVYTQALEALYQDSPYRRPKQGYRRSVNGLTRDEVLDFYHRYYVVNNMVVSVVGDVTNAQALERVRKALAGTGPETVPERPMADETLSQPITKLMEKDIPAAYIMIGYLAPSVSSADFPAMSVANAILGGGKASRLFANLRDKRGIGYEVGTIYPMQKYQSHLLVMLVTDLYKPAVSGSPREIVLQDAKDAILEEVSSLKQREVSDEELLRAKRYSAGTYALRHQRLSERAFSLGWFEAIGVGYQFDTDFAARTEAVTKADVLQVAKKYFTNYAMAVALPKQGPNVGSPFGER